jgi:hypothetical protein
LGGFKSYFLRNQNREEERKMSTKKSIGILIGMLVIMAWLLASVTQAGAETLNYKFYTYVVKAEKMPIGDVEGHTVFSQLRGSFLVFENGEVATATAVVTGDLVGGAGPFMQYVTITFEDGSTIIIKSEGTVGEPAAGTHRAGGWKSEIIKGTGRFQGIKGAHTAKAKYLPVEKWEAGPKGLGEGTITYTLPPK